MKSNLGKMYLTRKGIIVGVVILVLLVLYLSSSGAISTAYLSHEVVVMNKPQEVTVTAVSNTPYLFGIEARLTRQGGKYNVFDGLSKTLGKLKLAKVSFNGFTYQNTFTINYTASETVQIQLFSFGKNITPKPATYTVESSTTPSSSATITDPVPLRLAVSTRQFSLPPDPGEEGKKTIVGIDSDNDGLRDDIQREIFFAYPESERARRAIGDVEVTAMDRILNAEDSNALKKIVFSLKKRLECIDKVVKNDDFSRKYFVIINFEINTDLRFISATKSGEDTSGIYESQEESKNGDCLFNPDTLLD